MTAPSLPPQEVIRLKRDGGRLDDHAIAAMVRGMVAGEASWTDGQLAAFAMAVFFRGLDAVEQATLTREMARSGTVLDWRREALNRPVLDKHSTGGVGDKVSLMLAPLAAACGLAVPMISGRALGHTGGTRDKLASIPGYRTDPDLATFKRVVREVGCAIIGQTAELAPGDRRLYALRDTTATVESVPLITSSILSKKLAAGLDGLVVDVKVGSGAFMPSHSQALALARNLVRVGQGAGLPVVALLTDMDRVLGDNAGNGLEVREAIDFLTGRRREPRLRAVTLALTGEMLALAGVAPSPEAGAELAGERLADGSAAETFGRMVRALGGPSDLLDTPGRLPRAPFVRPAFPAGRGVVIKLDVRAVGLVVAALGGGRLRPEDEVAPDVGLSAIAAPGDLVGPERPLALVHARDEDRLQAAIAGLNRAFTLAVGTDDAYQSGTAPVVIDRITRA